MLIGPLPLPDGSDDADVRRAVVAAESGSVC